MGMDEQQKEPQRASRSALAIARVLVCLSLSACEESPQDRCVKARLKVWDAHSEKTPWRISEATGQTRSDFEAKARGWCEQESGQP
jgi:hypothetical protein